MSTLRGYIYRGVFSHKQPRHTEWYAEVGRGDTDGSWEHVAEVGFFESQPKALAAVEVALFDAKYPNCCHWCGWSLSSHGSSQYGRDCPWGASPAARAGHLRIVRRAVEASA